MCSSALCCAAERMAGAGGHIAGPMRPACLGVGGRLASVGKQIKSQIMYIERSRNIEQCYAFKRTFSLAKL